MGSFDCLKSLNGTHFQSVQKQKDYGKFLQRIQNIVHSRHSVDKSPSQYMKKLRRYKESANRMVRQESTSVIDIENSVLVEKLEHIKRRRAPHFQPYHVSSFIKRQIEMQKINKENEQMAGRLERCYAGSRSLFHSSSKTKELRKLPQINTEIAHS